MSKLLSFAAGLALGLLVAAGRHYEAVKLRALARDLSYQLDEAKEAATDWKG